MHPILEDQEMTDAVSIFRLLSETIERAPAPRRPVEYPQTAFGEIGLPALVAAVAANRRKLEAERRLAAPSPYDRMWR
jgi:hypothetical protein